MEPESTASELTVAVRTSARGVVVRPEGELDHDTAGPLRDALESAVGDGLGRVVIDCAGLDFCDSTGLNLLLHTRLDAEDAGLLLALADPGPMVSRMLDVTGVRAVFHIYPSVAEALAAPDV
ncbi:STAS domain-containing protein [Kitasatospora sp. NBC_00240]|uniref:STAS domain-containing protein n=1 Tax=Kitasatospora sp. NBC_00240 TaxID=2903567 RepID=UPI002250DE1B|nr:STAS domain-containing protein [Kitasatospora sp. NBC_00240]MCX5208529.1 STAS domain-containing protein [Kitasatospora sp. NBC_00240]